MNRETKAIVARLSGEAEEAFIDFARAIWDATNAAQIAEVLRELDDPKLTEQLDAEAIDHLKKSARIKRADFQDDAS